jgi:hypothetical protein
MKVPFPALTHLDLTGPDPDDDHEGVDLPHNFLGKSAPCLQHLLFKAISFKNLPKLLLSARDLVSLQLTDIPWVAGFDDYYGYILPKAMVGGLAGLARLRILCIKYQYPEDHLDSDEEREKGRGPEPPMRVVLPALTRFVFTGESKYLEDLVTRVDMPSVEDIEIEYFSPGAEVRQLSQFIGRTENFELAQFRRADVTFDVLYSQIKLDRPQGERHQVYFSLDVGIFGPELDVLVPLYALESACVKIVWQREFQLQEVKV